MGAVAGYEWPTDGPLKLRIVDTMKILDVISIGQHVTIAMYM